MRYRNSPTGYLITGTLLPETKTAANAAVFHSSLSKHFPRFFGSSRNGVMSRFQALPLYPASTIAGRQMPDDGRLHSNHGRYAIFAKRMAQ
ncbi:MAG: hypothetical protein ACJAUE_000242 [Alcanivorax sp.]|jgi:hypothetical protein